MNVLVQITAQYYENYGFSEGKIYWKPKGSLTYHLRADDDCFLYQPELSVEVIKEMLKKECNEAVKVEYLMHELIFHEPLELQEAEFDSLYTQFIEKKYADATI
jgi:hypothetical protein